MRAAQLSDDRYLADIEKAIEEQKRNKAEPSGPPLEDFDATVEAIYDLSDDIRLLIRALTKSSVPFRKRPEGPVERLKKRKKTYRLSRLGEILKGG